MSTAEYPHYKTADEVPCHCGEPCCSTLAYRVISRKPKRNGLVRVQRHCDCLLCGPFSYGMEVEPMIIAGNLVRVTLCKPLRMLGAPKNAEIRPSG